MTAVLMEEWCNGLMTAFATTQAAPSPTTATGIPNSPARVSLFSPEVAEAAAAAVHRMAPTTTIYPPFRLLPGYLWSTTHPTPSFAPPEPTEAPPPNVATVTLRLVTTPFSKTTPLVESLCQSWVYRQQQQQQLDHPPLYPNSDGDSDARRNTTKSDTNCWYEKIVSYRSDASVCVRLWDDDTFGKDQRDPVKEEASVDTEIVAVPSLPVVDRVVLCLPIYDDDDASGGDGGGANDAVTQQDWIKGQVACIQAHLVEENHDPSNASPPLVVVLVHTSPIPVTKAHHGVVKSSRKWETEQLAVAAGLVSVGTLQSVYTLNLSSTSDDDTSEIDHCFQSIVESVLADRSSSVLTCATMFASPVTPVVDNITTMTRTVVPTWFNTNETDDRLEVTVVEPLTALATQVVNRSKRKGRDEDEEPCPALPPQSVLATAVKKLKHGTTKVPKVTPEYDQRHRRVMHLS